MVNSVKMNLYLMSKMKSTYVFLLLILGYSAGMPVLLYSVGPVDGPMQFHSLCMSLFAPGIISLLLSLYAAILAGQELKTGFIKSVSNPLVNRGNILLAKVVSLFVYVTACVTLSCLVAWVAASSFAEVTFLGVGELVGYCLVQVLLLVGLCAVISCIAVAVNNTACGVAFAVLLSSGLVNILYQGIDSAVEKLAPSVIEKGFSVTQYVPTQNISTLVPGGSLLRPILVGVVFVILPTVIGYTVLNKRDVK